MADQDLPTPVSEPFPMLSKIQAEQLLRILQRPPTLTQTDAEFLVSPYYVKKFEFFESLPLELRRMILIEALSAFRKEVLRVSIVKDRYYSSDGWNVLFDYAGPEDTSFTYNEFETDVAQRKISDPHFNPSSALTVRLLLFSLTSFYQIWVKELLALKSRS